MFENLLIEKYRPKTLDDLCISEETKTLVLSWGNNIPNLLFVGLPGTGKTTLAQILAEDILKCDYIYINASDETGIDTIRSKVTGFVQTKSFDGNLKLVILDEADFQSKEAQASMRNLMESYAHTARFILTGNYKHKIDVALQSRCQSIDVRPTLKGAVSRCLQILQSEGIETTKEQKQDIVELVKSHFPDLRKCINEIQLRCINGIFNMSKIQDTSDVCELIYNNTLSKKGLVTRKYLIENDNIFNSDWDQLLKDLLNYVYSKDILDSIKKSMIITIAEHLEMSTRVIDKEINFFACILKLENQD